MTITDGNMMSDCGSSQKHFVVIYETREIESNQSLNLRDRTENA
jgi:hypothetical protein